MHSAVQRTQDDLLASQASCSELSEQLEAAEKVRFCAVGEIYKDVLFFHTLCVVSCGSLYICEGTFQTSFFVLKDKLDFVGCRVSFL